MRQSNGNLERHQIFKVLEEISGKVNSSLIFLLLEVEV